MTLFEILGLTRKPNASATALRHALDEIDIEGLERHAEALEAKRREVLLEGDDGALETIEADIVAANRAVERAWGAKERLEARLRDAEGQEGEGQRRHRYEAAKRKAAEAAKVLRRYERSAREIVTIIATIAEAEAEINSANADLPAGATRLASIEQTVRGLPSESETVLSREPMPATWHYAGRDAHRGEVDARLIGRIKSDDGITGTVEEVGHNQGEYGVRRWHVEKRSPGVRVKFLPSRPAYRPTALAAAVTLPALQPGAPVWEPIGGVTPGDGAEQVVSQAAHLASVTSQPPSDPRGPRQQQTRIERDTAADDVDSEQAA